MGVLSKKQIFISYPHNDDKLDSTNYLDDSYFEKTASETLFKYSAKDIKRIIEEAIAETGSDFKVWLDCDSIQAGSDFRKAIADGISSSAVVVMLVTGSYIAQDTKKWCNIERELTYIYRIPFIPISMEKGCILSDEKVFSRSCREFPISHLEIDDSFQDRLKDIIRNGITTGFDSSIYDYAQSYHLRPSCLVQDGDLVLDDNNTQQISTYVRRTDRISDIADMVRNLSDSGSMPLFICGESGSGKSELARAYADECYDKRYLAEFEWDLVDEKVNYATLDFKDFCDLISEKENGEISSVFPFLNSKVLLVFHINDLIENGIRNIGKLLSGGECKADIIVTTFQNVDSNTNAYRLDNEADKDVVGEVLLKNFENNNGDRAAFDDDKLLKICRAIDFNMVAARLIGSHLGSVYSLGKEEFLEEVDIVSQTSGLEEKEAWVDDFKHNNISASFDERILTVLKTVMFKNYNFLSDINDHDVDVLRYFALFPGRWIEAEEFKDSLFPYDKSAFARVKLKLIPKLIKFGYLAPKGTSYQMHNLIASFILLHLKECHADKMRDSFGSDICRNLFCVTEPKDLASKRFVMTKILDAFRKEIDDTSKILFKMLYEGDYSETDKLYGRKEHNELALIKLEYQDGSSIAFLDLTNLSEEDNYGVKPIISCGKTGALSNLPDGIPQEVSYLKLLPNDSEKTILFVQPDNVLGCKKSRIESRFAYNNEKLEAVVFSEGLEYIGEYAFSECYGLDGVVVLPDTITFMGQGAFEYCTNLKEIIFLGSLETISGYAFKYCKSIQSITFPLDLKVIGEEAFSYCSLSGVTLMLPDSVERIEKSAFKWCSISGIVLPSELTYIGDEAFGYCNHIRGHLCIDKDKVKIDGSPFNGCIWEQHSFSVDYLKKGEFDYQPIITIIKNVLDFTDYHYDDDEYALYIHEGVKTIPGMAFNMILNEICCNPGIQRVLGPGFVFPKRYRDVGQNVYLSNSVETIGKSAFQGCYAIFRVHCGISLTKILDEAFEGCEHLQQISLPDSLVSIGAKAFKESGLKHIELPNNLEFIGNSCFRDCRELEGTIQLPKSLIEIGDSAFSLCNKLEIKLVFGDNLKMIGKNAFFCGVVPPSDGEVYFPKSLEMIGDQVFRRSAGIEKMVFLNRQTRFGRNINSGNTDVIIKGYPGSTAEIYATENGLKFEYIEQ